MMTGSEREDDFEAYLRRRMPIDRRLKSLGRLEPPAELDRLIIGKAREAIQGAPPVPVFRAPRWALPMGLAATILISLSVLLDLGMQGAIRRDAGKAPALWVGVVPESAADPRTSQAASPSQGLPSVAMAPTPSPTAPSRSSSPATSARSSERIRPAPLRTAPWPPALDAVARSAASSKAATVVDEAVNPSTAGDDTRGRLVEHSLAASRVRRSADASGTGSAEPLPAAPPAEAHMEIVTVIGTRVHEAYAMSAVAASPVTSISSEAIESAPSYVPDISNIQIEGGPSWAAERHRHPNPKVWLDHIRKMRAAGLTAAADQELRRFHDAYPDFPAPPDPPSADGGAQ
jgi:hypothetical protein